MLNGNIVGKVNAPTSITASGVWTKREQFLARAGSNWPIPGLASATFGGGYLSVGANSLLAVGTGDFTYEAWIKATSASDTAIMESRSVGTATDGFTLTAFSSSVIRIFCGSALISASGLSYLNTWTHVAVTRSSGTWNLFVNGTSAGTSSASVNLSNNDLIVGGGRYSSGSSVTSTFPGSISNYRLVKGQALYSGNFTPAGPLNPISNTSLLTCWKPDSTGDFSGNNLTVTASGTVSASSTSPFA